MKILYFDCTNGISGDMVFKALMDIGACEQQVRERVAALNFQLDHGHHHHHEHHNHHHEADNGQNRSYETVKHLIHHSSFSRRAKETALSIYEHIAAAEAKVHGETLETIHFHEVGRNQAIGNALGIGMALEVISPDKIYTSYINDGKGTVTCSHGEIPVPVPAVMALRENCSYEFRQADVNMEMVTPSGLATLMGMDAEPDPSGSMVSCSHDEEETDFRITPGKAVRILAQTEAKGTRDTGRPGLRAYLVEEDVN